MALTPIEWHQRYVQQAAWTQNLRAYIYQQVHIANASRVLEVGCGTGAILPGLPTHTNAQTFGVDISAPNLKVAQRQAPSAHITLSDAHNLPFANGSFDFVFCHYLLLWVENPLQALTEMKRVVRSGGFVAALAEPDYTARIDYPPELSNLGELQRLALSDRGANPALGRQLGALFSAASISRVMVGVLGGEWYMEPGAHADDLEWAILEDDLGALAKPPSPQLIQNWRRLDDQAHQSGERILFVPTFYAWGQAL